MPAVAAAAASAFAAISAGAAAVGTAAASVGAGLGFSAAVSTGIGAAILKTAGYAALSYGLNALSPKPKVNLSQQLNVTIGSVSPRTMIMGRTAVAGTRLTDSMYTAKNDSVGAFVTAFSGIGETGVVEAVIWGDDEIIFDGSGNVTSPSKYINKMWLYQKSGSWTQSAIIPPASLSGVTGSVSFSEWTSNHRALGCLHSMLLVKTDAAVFKNNMQTPLFVIDANSIALTDPRTGSAATTEAQRRNPWVWYYSFSQSWLSPTFKRVAGVGLSASQVDVVTIAYNANVADANGWTIGGEIVLDPSNYSEVLRAIARCGGGEMLVCNGLLSATISSPKASVFTITDAYLNGKVHKKCANEGSYKPNRIQPRYISEANLWKVVDGTVVTDATYIAADGGFDRTESLELPYVAGGDSHIGNLAAYALANAREPFIYEIPLKPSAFYQFKTGDAVTLNVDNESTIKLIVIERQINVDLSSVATCLTETDTKHAWALGEISTPPVFTSQYRIDYSVCPAPSAGAWSVSADTIVSNGATLPILRITGASDFEGASAVVIKLKVDGGTDWRTSELAPSDVTDYELRGLTPNTNYIVGIAYRNQYGIEGSTYDFSVTTTSDLIISTQQIADNSVTSRAFSYNTGSYDPNSASTWTQIGDDVEITADGVNYVEYELFARVSDYTTAVHNIRLYRDSTLVVDENVTPNRNEYLFFKAIDLPSSGTYIYSVEMKKNSSSTDNAVLSKVITKAIQTLK